MRLSKIIFGLIAATSVFGVFLTSPVNAQAANANAAQGIQISPTLVELNAAKGKTYNIALTVTNVTASDLVYTSSLNDFNAADETGSPHIILDSKLPATASIVTWVATVPKFTLTAHKSMVVNAQITIPDNAEPGGHYGVLRFSGAAPEVESTGVGLSASAGVLILIRVDGTITEKANLASFYTSPTQNGKQGSFFENGPIWFVTRIQNEGNIHVKPVGNIEVRDMFGGLVANLPVNKDKSNILPNSIRRFDDAKLDKPWMIGLYTVNLTLGYGTTGQAITNTISFWVIPYKLILAILFVLVTIVFILKQMIRVYNKRITEKIRNEIKNQNKNHPKDKD
jgi:hypothetical protein